MSTLQLNHSTDHSLRDLLDLDRLITVGLDDVVASAALLHRVDRKYLVNLRTAHQLIEELAVTHAVLKIGDRLSTSYRSTYYDTPTLSSCRAHIQGRRLRWKVRSRLYVEDKLCRIEVKTKNGRGATAKTVLPSDADSYGTLTSDARAFIANTLGISRGDLDVAELVPTAEVTYARSTLADLGAGTRVTLDWNLLGTLSAGQAWIDTGYLLIETKGNARPATADRALARLGARPRGFSKYVATTAMVRPDIADNDIRHLRGRSLHTALTRP